MNVRLAMENVPIHVPIQMVVTTVNAILDVFFNLTSMTALNVSSYKDIHTYVIISWKLEVIHLVKRMSPS